MLDPRQEVIEMVNRRDIVGIRFEHDVRVDRRKGRFRRLDFRQPRLLGPEEQPIHVRQFDFVVIEQ